MEERQKIKDKIEQRAKNGKISCAQALQLAKNLNLPPSKIGEVADQSGIKITGCQLGCFR